MNVSSVVVQAKAEYIEELVEVFKNCDFCDYHFHDASIGKIIVTVDGEGVDDEIKNLKKVQRTPHVIAADMMMTYSEDELDAEREKLEKVDPVPEILNRKDVKAKDIEYHGDLRHRKDL